MKNKLAILALLVILATEGTGQTLPAVETLSQISTGQKPAFPGQTRVAGVQSKTKAKLQVVASGLQQPWGLDFLPDGRMIVSEKSGNIRLVTKSGVVGPPIANVPEVRLRGDGGMYDVKIYPDFAKSRLVFWTFVEEVTGGGVTSVARGKLSMDEKKFEEVKISTGPRRFTKNPITMDQECFLINRAIYS